MYNIGICNNSVSCSERLACWQEVIHKDNGELDVYGDNGELDEYNKLGKAEV